MLAPDERDLRRVAEPFLHDLHSATRATVHLAVREGDEVLYVDRISGSVSVPVVSQTGGRLPLHATGVGKVLLAHAPLEVRERVLGHLTRVTAYTVVQPGRLRAQLERVRRDGYATTVDEMSLGASSVGVPVWRGKEVAAALGVVVPRLGRDRPALLAALQVAAGGIARSFSREGVRP